METKYIKHNPIKIYKRNKAQFYNLDFYVDQRVYVPNPETELMVEYAIQYIRDNNLTNGILVDVGTGCGNIAITLAKHFPKCKIIATDISLDAIDIAKKNASFHKVHNIEFINTNLIFCLQDQPDLIIGNLPWGDDDHLLPTNTKAFLSLMPAVSIFSPDGIIGTYNHLIEQIKSKNWSVNVIIETGVLERETIELNLVKGCRWEYKMIPSAKFKYSVTAIQFTKRSLHEIIHHHLLYNAVVNREDLTDNSSSQLIQFLRDLVELIDMQILIEPRVAFSHQKAWTGLVGIVTSHISFHYWPIDRYIQVDIYSCKEFDLQKAISFLNDFWKATNERTLILKRGAKNDFIIEKE